jgi:NAD(P)-dependent dehydrogenase (short-subunit alcohol dehydrogenase family)
MAEKKIWFITGISSGLGKALAQSLKKRGDFVLGTFRNQKQVDDFNQLNQEHAFSILLDLNKEADIQNAFNVVREKYGKLDVLVNNGGMGFAGAIEETSIEETRMIFETNFFGALEITRAFLPLFRQQRRGHIIQISSHGGVKAFAGFGIYNASKFALEGFSEALAQEILPIGVKLTIVEPGPFRTNFAGESFRLAKARIDDYNESAGLFREKMKGIDGKQEGDPLKAAKAIIEITNLNDPPLRLPLGKMALNTINSKLDSIRQDLEASKSIAESVVFSE